MTQSTLLIVIKSILAQTRITIGIFQLKYTIGSCAYYAKFLAKA